MWTEEKITQLLEDFAEFSAGESPFLASQYYLGTLLFHQKQHLGRNCYCVIDGQQRLTTLAILYWLLEGALPDFVLFEFRSSHSLVNVQQAKNTMQAWLQQHKGDRPLYPVALYCDYCNTRRLGIYIF